MSTTESENGDSTDDKDEWEHNLVFDEHCQCIASDEDWDEGVYSCSTEVETDVGCYRCSRPTGHDGPHAACAPTTHPVLVFDDDGQILEYDE